jgi:hypothetical protein
LATEQSAETSRDALAEQRVESGQSEENPDQDYNVTTLAQKLPLPGAEPRPVSSRNDSIIIENSENRLGASNLEGDTILPDDSSISYIGTLHLLRRVFSSLIVPGDKRGPRQSVYDLCHPGTPQEARPYLPARAPNTSHKPHEVEYMRHQGAFTLLPSDVCDALICCYFQHVHFFLPIIDAPSFLNEYINNGPQNVNLLLFWSMFLAAANVSLYLQPSGRCLCKNESLLTYCA